MIPERTIDRAKILIFSLEFPPFIGGVSIYNYEIAISMVSLGYKVKVITCNYPSMYDEEKRVDTVLRKEWNIEIVRKKTIKGMSLLHWVILLHKFIRSPDNCFEYVLITDIGAQRVSSFVNLKKGNTRYFITVHGSEIFTTFVKRYASKGIMSILFPFFKRHAEAFFSKADGIIFVSEYTKRLFGKYFKGKIDRGSVIHNGIKRSMILSDYGLRLGSGSENKRCVLITVSRLDSRKNHTNVIRQLPPCQRV